MARVIENGSVKTSDPLYKEGFKIVMPKQLNLQSESSSESLESKPQKDSELMDRQMKEASVRGAEKRKNMTEEQIERLASQLL